MEPIHTKEHTHGSSIEQAEQKTYNRFQAGVLGKSIIQATKLAASGLVRLELVGLEHIQACVDQGRPIIFAGWHGHNFLTMCSYYKKVRFLTKGAILVPNSSHGTIMNQIGKALDLQVVQVKPGSGAPGWGRATVSMIRLLRGGSSALLSPDGPTGPARIAKPGIVVIAQQAKAVIIPASAATSMGVQLRGRWDEHLIPLPFSKAVVHFGAPIDAAPPDADQPSEEKLLTRVEESLAAGERAARECCKRVGRRGDASQ